MSIMSCYYQPVSEEVKGLPITCHTGTESESWYSPSQTLTLELEGGVDIQGHALVIIFILGEIGFQKFLTFRPLQKLLNLTALYI